MRFTIAAIMALAVAGVKLHHHEPSEREKDGRRIFNAIDINDDGEMDRKEFHDAINQFESWEVIDAQGADNAKDLWDDNMGRGDTLTFEQTGEVMMEILGEEGVKMLIANVEDAAAETVAWAIFDEADKNENGTVSLEEFAAFGNEVGIELSEHEKAEIAADFMKIAGDDKEISWDEAHAAVKLGMKDPETRNDIMDGAAMLWEMHDDEIVAEKSK